MQPVSLANSVRSAVKRRGFAHTATGLRYAAVSSTAVVTRMVTGFVGRFIARPAYPSVNAVHGWSRPAAPTHATGLVMVIDLMRLYYKYNRGFAGLEGN